MTIIERRSLSMEVLYNKKTCVYLQTYSSEKKAPYIQNLRLEIILMQLNIFLS